MNYLMEHVVFMYKCTFGFVLDSILVVMSRFYDQLTSNLKFIFTQLNQEILLHLLNTLLFLNTELYEYKSIFVSMCLTCLLL